MRRSALVINENYKQVVKYMNFLNGKKVEYERKRGGKEN